MGLKEYRIMRGMTQEKVARLSDINLRTYQYIEEKNNTDILKAKTISLMLGADTIEECFMYKENKK